MGAQDAHARRVERRDPHRPGDRADERGDAAAHLVGRLVGERDGEDRRRRHAFVDEMGDAMREHPRLARSGPGDDEQRAAAVDDGVELVGVEPVETRRCAGAGGAASALRRASSVTGELILGMARHTDRGCGTDGRLSVPRWTRRRRIMNGLLARRAAAAAAVLALGGGVGTRRDRRRFRRGADAGGLAHPRLHRQRLVVGPAPRPRHRRDGQRQPLRRRLHGLRRQLRGIGSVLRVASTCPTPARRSSSRSAAARRP